MSTHYDIFDIYFVLLDAPVKCVPTSWNPQF